MSLDQHLTQAMQQIAEDVRVPVVDLATVRSTARTQRVRTFSMVAAAVVAVVVAASSLVAGRDTNAPGPASNAPSWTSVAPSPTTTPLLTFTSRQYDLTVKYPLGWSPFAAERAWSWTVDVQDAQSPGHDWFLSPESPEGDVRVSVWAAPIDPATRKESTAYLLAWVEDYCEKSGNSPCTNIADRAVELCVEKRDCHPGLLVAFKEDVQAFFSGGAYAKDAMTIVAVWRPERDRSVMRYGGARLLLETFLATMDVWPKHLAVATATTESTR